MTDAQENLPALPEVRIGDTDREIAARQLRIAMDEGQLDLMELDKRLASVYAAQTSTELVAVTADLPVAAAAREPIELRTGSGSRDKSGHWIVPPELTAECSSGTITIDFTQALCTHREVVVHAAVRSGAIRLLVPHGWRVDLDRVRTGSGAVQNKVTEPPLPGSTLIRVDGEIGSGVIVAGYPRPPRRSFLAWILRRPRPAA
ncbi:DUF1707 SHOCT-like domain-containing protein [Nocardia australiensis]|uniref:DUF1707 SHOCT-like domain-containing protein n=1 Tax=Nocardia australiensis TaxID=2887191 RepID=UPI001D139D26|nr:DUF1707 domain-containing protein [Nocardia australiensis]